MATEEQTNVELLHPFYLDTDMCMAFAAVLTGGVSLQKEEVEREGEDSTIARNLSGNLRIFDLIGVGAGRESGSSSTLASESRMVKQHTEASIFITLHDELKRSGQIHPLALNETKPGEMVSVDAGPAIAPLRRVLDQIIRLLDLIDPVLAGEGSEATAESAATMTRQQKRELQRQLAKAAVEDPDDQSGLRRMKTLFAALKDDLDRSGLIDIVITQEEEPSLLLTLDKRFLDGPALELLHTSRFKVIGKVTQIWTEPDDVVNLFRRSVMSLVPALTQVASWSMFAFLASAAGALDVKEMEEAARKAANVPEDPGASSSGEEADETDSDESDEEVLFSEDVAALHPALTGPIVQILPLAICA
jgi:hypothetical protein